MNMIAHYGIRLLIIFTLSLITVTGCSSISSETPGAVQPVIRGDSLAIMGVVDPQKPITNHVVQNGEHINVGPGGGATITFSDTSTIFLQAGAEAIVSLQQSQPSLVNLLKGTVRAQGAAKSFAVQTSDAMLMPSARDTIFTVYNTASRKSVEVTNGAVEVRGASGAQLKVTAGNNINLTNQPTAVPSAPEPTVAPTTMPITAPQATVAPTLAPTVAPQATNTPAPAPTSVPEATVAPTQAPAAPAAPVATTNDNGVSLRSGPNTNTTIIVSLQQDTQVSVLGEENDWTHVRLADGREGWIFTRFLMH